SYAVALDSLARSSLSGRDSFPSSGKISRRNGKIKIETEIISTVRPGTCSGFPKSAVRPPHSASLFLASGQRWTVGIQTSGNGGREFSNYRIPFPTSRDVAVWNAIRCLSRKSITQVHLGTLLSPDTGSCGHLQDCGSGGTSARDPQTFDAGTRGGV